MDGVRTAEGGGITSGWMLKIDCVCSSLRPYCAPTLALGAAYSLVQTCSSVPVQ